jgi:GTP-binding protein
MAVTIAIVGRPNVGKSTLFNRLLGERKSIVHDRPGVTRDRNYGTLEWGERQLLLVDTGGFEPEGEGLLGAMRAQVRAAMEEADVLIFVLDRKTGLTPPDELAAEILRSCGKPVLMAVNKVDHQAHEDELGEFWKLGFGDLYPLSAEHGRGLHGLMTAVVELLPPPRPDELETSALEDGASDEPDSDEPREWRVAILGRPNIGKSTLANRLVGEDRHLVHDAPGTTMDAVDSDFEALGHRWRIVDTAGVRRRARIEDVVEGFAVSRAIRTIERCHMVLLMLDGTEPPSTQDARLAHLAEDRGRAVIIVINRWDLVRGMPDRNSTVVEEELQQSFPHLSWAPRMYVSALTGKGCHRLLPKALEVLAQFDRRIPTPELNRLLREIESTNPPPQRHHHPVRMHFVSQTRVRPPTFAFFSNSPDGITASYRRYLANTLRDRYGFEGTPLRVHVRKKRKTGDPT